MRFSIGQAAKELGVSKETLRRWEAAGKVPKAKRDPMSNYRYWTQQDVERLKKMTGRAWLINRVAKNDY